MNRGFNAQYNAIAREYLLIFKGLAAAGSKFQWSAQLTQKEQTRWRCPGFEV